jgi:hypothetical protein
LSQRNSEPALLADAPDVAPLANGHASAPAGECAPQEAPAPAPEPARADLAAPEPPSPAPDDAPCLPAPPSDPPAAPLALLNPDGALSPLEERVRRLEEELARLRAVKAPEVRVAQLVTLPPAQPPPVAVPVAPPPSTAGMLLGAGKRWFGAAASAARKAPAELKRAALFWDGVAEARSILRMYLDPRYRLSWLGRLVPAALVLLIALSGWWVPGGGVPVFGTYFHPLLVKGFDLLLAFALFKVLGYEARRYRETAPDLPPSLRL